MQTTLFVGRQRRGDEDFASLEGDFARLSESVSACQRHLSDELQAEGVPCWHIRNSFEDLLQHRSIADAAELRGLDKLKDGESELAASSET